MLRFVGVAGRPVARCCKPPDPVSRCNKGRDLVIVPLFCAPERSYLVCPESVDVCRGSLFRAKGPTVTEERSELEPEFTAQEWRVRWHDYVPAAALVLIMTLIWLTHSPAEMSSWGVSAAALASGRYETIVLHMFAHGGVSHIVMN